MTATRTSELGPASRPVAIPADVDAAGVDKASGMVELPPRVRWSGQKKIYDLSKRLDLIRVYEQVLREGTNEDVAYFIDPDKVLDLWDDLVLPGHVRAGWAAWLREHRSVDPTC